MNNILVPVDFSDCSLSAFKVAAELAKKTESKLTALVNVPKHLDNFLFYEYPIKFPDENVFESWLENKNCLLKNCLPEGNDSFNLINTQGVLEDEIEAQVQKNNIDLVVMGTSGASGIKQHTIGSNTQKVMRNISAPLLAVKYEPKRVKFKNIVFLSKFNLDDKSAFEWTCNFGSFYDAHIHLLNIDTPSYFMEIPELIKSSMDDFKNSKPHINITNHTRRGFTPEMGLSKFLKEKEIDLVVVTTKGVSGLASVFHFSVAEGIVNHLAVPVISIKN